jgi:hypothetical protein
MFPSAAIDRAATAQQKSSAARRKVSNVRVSPAFIIANKVYLCIAYYPCLNGLKPHGIRSFINA